MSDYERGYKAAVIDTVKKCIVSNEAERAVIEAARNLVHGWRWTTDDGEEITVQPWDYYSQDLLTEKLRALNSETIPDLEDI